MTRLGWIALLLPLSMAVPAPAQNLLVSSDFDVASDVADWPDPFPDPDTTIAWESSLDVDGSSSSGSLRLETAIDNGAADGPEQCVDTGPGSYDVEAWVYDPAQSPQPQVYVSLDYYPSAGCSGSFSGTDDAFWSGALDAWDQITFTGTAPPGTASVAVRLFSGNTVDPTPVAVYYDAIFLPEPGGSGPLLFASLTLLRLRSRRRRSTPIGWATG